MDAGILFIEGGGLTGRASEESCESCIYMLEQLNQILKRIRKYTDRVNTNVGRSQGNLKKIIYLPKMKIKTASMGKPRGGYSVQARQDEY